MRNGFRPSAAWVCLCFCWYLPIFLALWEPKGTPKPFRSPPLKKTDTHPYDITSPLSEMEAGPLPPWRLVLFHSAVAPKLRPSRQVRGVLRAHLLHGRHGMGMACRGTEGSTEVSMRESGPVFLGGLKREHQGLKARRFCSFVFLFLFYPFSSSFFGGFAGCPSPRLQVTTTSHPH